MIPMNGKLLTTCLVAAALALPAGAATWFGPGTYEPDTRFDEDEGQMYTAADTDPAGKRVYFNVFGTQWPAGVNPNVGVAGGRFQPSGIMHFNAHFGVWKDCNEDGYVGVAESALTAYRAEALLETAVCPSGSFHNDGQWVLELVPIGYNETDVDPDSTAGDQSPNFIDVGDLDGPAGSHGAYVWGDQGAPGAVPGLTCPIVPAPHGTFARTGATVRWADCILNGRIADNVNGAAAASGLDFGFDDRNNPQNSDSPLNQDLPQSLFGSPYTGDEGTFEKDSCEDDGAGCEAAFTAWDCSARSQDVRDETGLLPTQVDDVTTDDENDALFTLSDDDGSYFWMGTPSPSVGDPQDSVADGLNDTFNGFNLLDDTAGGSCTDESTEETSGNTYELVHETAFFYTESKEIGGSGGADGGKFEAATFFRFTDGGAYAPTCVEDVCGPDTGDRTPGFFGVNALDATGVSATPMWRSDTIYAAPPQSINRATLQPQGAGYWSFYASVDPAEVAAHGLLFAGPGGTYGAENCASGIGAGKGVENGWRCDPANWYVDGLGKPVADPENLAQRVGVHWTTRDIDCYDGRLVRGVNVFVSLVAASATPEGCVDAS